jgi:hypothetical protein
MESQVEELGRAPVVSQLIPSYEYAPVVLEETTTYLIKEVPVPPAYTLALVPSYVAAI